MDAFTGEIRILPYSFAPQYWADCNGQKIAFQQNIALYSIIGNYYGPTDQKTYFTLPNLQGQVVMGTGAGPGLTARTIGQKVGAETVALSIAQMAPHTHTVTAKIAAAPTTTMSAAPTATSWLSRAIQVSGTTTTPITAYTASGTPDVALDDQVFGPAGGSGAAHENRQPYLPMRFCICVNGTYPMRP